MSWDSCPYWRELGCQIHEECARTQSAGDPLSSKPDYFLGECSRHIKLESASDIREEDARMRQESYQESIS